MKALWIGILVSGMTYAAEPSLKIEIGGGVSIDLILIRAGEFFQGSPADEVGRGEDEVQRQVRLSKDFYIASTAITRGQWERFVAESGYRSEAEIGTSGGFGWDGKALSQRKEFTWKHPGFPQAADHPVCLVTFPDAEAFCRWFEKKSHRKTTLPTEAQWEYACRAGTSTPWHSGDANTSDLAAWHKSNSGDGTRPSASKQPNAWELFISGNVSEWCLDWYAPYDVSSNLDPRQDNKNLSDKPRRVLRGGSWLRDPKHTRSAARYRVDPRSRNADIGFRIVCAAEAAVPLVEMPNAEAPLDQPAKIESPPTPIPPAQSSQLSWLKGLPCLLIPLGLIVLLVRFASRGRTQVSPFVVTANPPLRLPVQSIRKVADGFWVKSSHAVGTPLLLKYMVDGNVIEQTLPYQPGPEGQFIFTGSAPGDVSVSGVSNLPPPLSRRSSTSRRFGEDSSADRNRPPIFPAAY
jgi:sulfatase modifying factor 1